MAGVQKRQSNWQIDILEFQEQDLLNSMNWTQYLIL